MKSDRYSLHPVQDRFQPALLDRLTDTAPRRAADPAGGAILTHAELRQSVLRDLRWLLNTLNLETTHDLAAHAQVRESTLNYGIGAMAGRRMSEVDWLDLETAITQAIRTFEPRILSETLVVRCATEADTLVHHNIVSLSIQGMLWCIPYPLAFLFRTEIDLESGDVALADMGAAA
ncbi:type VI secretion system baseplate subunit TssE [Pusillimonas noertemannii]|uniref:type VI secretion system baseplate subunit TssE n=1 Tax=Pusillimonas noertemannii TaxID=305977 RepID=UPI00031D8028|nr:type VI secretion system baseplate subunit TssE [Pusillimonas noertemannii]